MLGRQRCLSWSINVSWQSRRAFNQLCGHKNARRSLSASTVDENNASESADPNLEHCFRCHQILTLTCAEQWETYYAMSSHVSRRSFSARFRGGQKHNNDRGNAPPSCFFLYSRNRRSPTVKMAFLSLCHSCRALPFNFHSTTERQRRACQLRRTRSVILPRFCFKEITVSHCNE